MTDTNRRNRNSLLAMIALALFAVAITTATIVMQKSRMDSIRQDCAASGQTNCAAAGSAQH